MTYTEENDRSLTPKPDSNPTGSDGEALRQEPAGSDEDVAGFATSWFIPEIEDLLGPRTPVTVNLGDTATHEVGHVRQPPTPRTPNNR